MMEPSIIVALIALLGTLFTAVFATLTGRNKYTRTEAVKLENRLTLFESDLNNKATKTEFLKIKAQIASIHQTLEDKLDPIWNAIMHELPKVLISPGHSELDSLIRQALNGLETLNDDEIKILVEGLEKEYIGNSKADSGKRMVAILLKNGIKAQRNII